MTTTRPRQLFQHTAARRRLVISIEAHHHPEGFNTQPPEGGWEVDKKVAAAVSAVSTHSRPKAAGYTSDNLVHLCQVSTHSRPKAAGTKKNTVIPKHGAFQHTAARRRLGRNSKILPGDRGFNTQPPEGGWALGGESFGALSRFQHTAARRRLVTDDRVFHTSCGFQHTAARRRLVNQADTRVFLEWFQHTAARRRLGIVGRFPILLRRFNTQPPEGGWVSMVSL